jgi:hypothetical protein
MLYEHEIPDMFLGHKVEETLHNYGLCNKCESIAEREREEREQEQMIQDERMRRLDDAKRRLDESNLLKYELAFDPDNAHANRALMSWMLKNMEHSIWIYGATGRGKTRTIQYAAREAVKDRSVRYWPTYDLAARLTETSKKPESQLFDIYDADLLILDDLGVANMTAARLTALTAIVDRRYIGWDQVRRRQHTDMPAFNLFSLIRRRGLGGQLWITSQVPPDELIQELATINANDAAALVRRLADMCLVHEAEEVR